MSDTELLDLIPFFERLSHVDNVYTVLRNSNQAALTNRSDSISMAMGHTAVSNNQQQQQHGTGQMVDLNSVAINVA